MPLEIKKINKEEIFKLKQLFENTQNLAEYDPFKNGSVEAFKWQFFNDGYKSSTYVAAVDTEREEILGTLAALIIPMKTPNGDICQTIKPEDTLVNIHGLIRHKNRDLLREMLDKIDLENRPLNIKFFWGFTYAVDSFKRMGFIQKFSSKQGMFVVNPLQAYVHLVSLNHSNGAKQKIQIFALSLLSYFKAIVQNKNTSGINYKEIDLKSVDEGLMVSFLPKDLYCLYLDKYYLDWRIENNPSSLDYSIVQFTDQQNKIISYLIYSKKNNSVSFIEQFLFDPKLNRNEKLKIIHAAIQHLKRNAAIIRVMGFNHNPANREEIDLLSSGGFVFINRGIPFIFKSNDERIKPEDVYLSRLNTEGTF